MKLLLALIAAVTMLLPGSQPRPRVIKFTYDHRNASWDWFAIVEPKSYTLYSYNLATADFKPVAPEVKARHPGKFGGQYHLKGPVPAPELMHYWLCGWSVEEPPGWGCAGPYTGDNNGRQASQWGTGPKSK